jgi:hypothetical protein
MTKPRVNSSKYGDRDRPGRPSRRPADWFRAPRISPKHSHVLPPKTAGETPAIPGQLALPAQLEGRA